MQQTPNLGLNKPEYADVVDIEKLNANMDIIDAKLGTNGHNHNGTVGQGPKISADNVTSKATGTISATNVQAAIDELEAKKQPLDATLTALAGLNTAANQIIYTTGSDSFSTATLSAFIRTLLDDANPATARETLGAAPLFSPSLTGIPTAPTASIGTNTTQIASTEFVRAAITAYSDGIIAASLTQNGYVKFRSGLMIQWGRIDSAVGSFTFPIAFSNNCFTLVMVSYNGTNDRNITVSALTVTGATVYTNERGICWIAIGN